MCTAAVNIRTFAVLPASGLGCISLKGTSRPTSLQSKTRTNISVSVPSFNVWFILQQFAQFLQLMLSNTADPRNWKQGHMNSPRPHHPVSVLETKMGMRTSRNTFTCSDNNHCWRTCEHEYIQFQCFSFLRTFLEYSGHMLAQVYENNMKKLGALKQQWAPQQIKENQSKDTMRATLALPAHQLPAFYLILRKKCKNSFQDNERNESTFQTCDELEHTRRGETDPPTMSFTMTL